MELDFHKEKQRVAGMSDADLSSRLRDPALSATDKMLVEAEISRRGIKPGRVAMSGVVTEATEKKRSSPFGTFIFVMIALSVLTAILDDFGFDIIEWLRDISGLN